MNDMTQVMELPSDVAAIVAAAEQAIAAQIKEATMMSPLPGGGQWIHRRGWTLSQVRGYNGNHTDGAVNIMDETFGKENSERMLAVRKAAKQQGVKLVEDIDDYYDGKTAADIRDADEQTLQYARENTERHRQRRERNR